MSRVLVPPMWVIIKDDPTDEGPKRVSVAYGVLAPNAAEAWKQLKASQGDDFAQQMRKQGYRARKARVLLES